MAETNLFVLDTSALLALRGDEAGADRVEALLSRARDNKCRLLISFMSRMEVLYLVWREEGELAAREALRLIDSFKIEWVSCEARILEIASRLKAGESPIADAYDAATILFADIVGFTPLTQELDPKEMVQLLNEVFSEFDRAAERHGIEKIRTIGDNWMGVAGVPTRRDGHAGAVARMALDMCAGLDRLRARGERRIDVRIGIESGPCVGGVIGLQKFVFDIWGDPVNTASRMESHGVAGRVHVGEAAYKLLEDSFVFEPRGVIEVKGKGAMRTWFLISARATESDDPGPRERAGTAGI